MKKQYFALILTIILAVSAVTAGHYILLNCSVLGNGAVSVPELILDAGHGGEDGGAVSITGIPESGMNLAIVLDMEDILGLYGVTPLLLRREDVSLHSPGAETLREKKVSDLKNRVAMIESARGADLISIHQNSYPDSRQRGLQVFYAPTEGSEQLGLSVQQTVQKSLQQGNSRPAKQIPKNVYLMNHISCRAVLVECGFLTNFQEEQLLNSGWYRRKLAAALCGAWLTERSVRL